MLEQMKDIVKSNDLCVLATVAEGKPHCSLMSYLSNEEGNEVYMISQKQTSKYHNLMENPTVSLLIDTREKEQGRRRMDILALTVAGQFHPITDPDKIDFIRSQFSQKLPHLSDFLNHADSEIFCIRVKSYQLLKGVRDSFFEKID